MVGRVVREVKRWWLAVLCYLAVGGAIGVLIAWTIANSRVAHAEVDQPVVVIERGGWPVDAYFSRGGGVAHVLFIVADARVAPGPADRIPPWALRVLDESGDLFPEGDSLARSELSVFATGWPCVSVMGADGSLKPELAPGPLGVYRVSRSIRLPYLPIWRGLLFNAVFYSPVPFTFHWMWRAGLRRWRRSRGLCESCGYNRRSLAADAKCPECGTTPTPPAAAK